MTDKLNHFDSKGNAIMVDITEKNITERKAIAKGKIFVNGAESLHNIYYCKQGDVLSIRGFGKIRFGETLGVTKKDRIRFSYRIFS